MTILIVMIPLSILLLIGAGIAFFWAVDHDQFDDMKTPALLPLLDYLMTFLRGKDPTRIEYIVHYLMQQTRFPPGALGLAARGFEHGGGRKAQQPRHDEGRKLRGLVVELQHLVVERLAGKADAVFGAGEFFAE